MVLFLSIMTSISFAQKDDSTKLNAEKQVWINYLRGEQKLKVGQVGHVSLEYHESVGIFCDVYSLNDELKLVKTTLDYEHDSSEGPMLDGGDSAYKTFYFKADKPGEYEIVMKRIFQGETESENTIKIIVE